MIAVGSQRSFAYKGFRVRRAQMALRNIAGGIIGILVGKPTAGLCFHIVLAVIGVSVLYTAHRRIRGEIYA